MKRLISIYILLALIVPRTSATIIKGTVLSAGDPIPAEYTLLEDGTVGLGTGHNACISQYNTGRITVPSQITSGGKTYNVSRIMPMAFRLCNKTKVVIVREGIKSIGDFAFVGCSSLIEIELPSTTESIGTGALVGLNNLVALICKAENPPVWEYNDVCFFHKGGISDTQVQQFPEDVSLFVPLGADEAYRQAKFNKPQIGWNTLEGWGTAFATIQGSAMDGYRIYSQEDLYELHKIINNPGNYGEIKELYLETNINMSGYEFTTPIADTEEHAFTGTFHGQGHYIRNLTINSETVAGLFGYYKGKKITGVRLENCDFRGKQLAGGLVAQCGACTIDSCYVSSTIRTDVMGGGIVGRTTGDIIIDRCVSEGVDIAYTQSSSSNPCFAGIVGSTTGATITNCAMLKNFNFGSKSSIFVGACANGGTANIDYCYSTNNLINTLTPATTNIKYGEHIIVQGEPLSILDYAGERHDFKYDWLYFQTIYPAAVLGFEGWAYCKGHCPLPDCFADLWPIKPNHAVYGSPALAEQRINVLTPDEDIPASAWLDLSEIGFRHYRFKASQLWIDDNMNVYGQDEQLPLGISRQITVENGIMLEDTLRAGNWGTVPVYEPVYLLNEQNEWVYDEEGNMIVIDSLFIYDKNIWVDKVYSLCLPYNVALSSNCSLYQPTQIYDVDGETKALFARVRDNYVEAFRPYIVVVHDESVPLGTHTRVVCPALDSKAMRLDNYEFEGTMTRKGNILARESNFYLLEDERHWLRFKDSGSMEKEVEPFTAYFHCIDGTPAKRITIVLDDDNPVISVGDFYYAINNADPENVTASLLGYHGRGGNVVVPATAPYVLYGQKQEVPLTDLAPDIFTKSTAQVWSIDMSQCTNLKPVTIDRTAAGNPFYKVDERTIIYMPEGKAGAGKNNVIGTECKELTLTDGWDFVPPYNFHADEATYDRIFYAAKQKDGSFERFAYTVCVPFTMTHEEFVKAVQPDFYVNLYVLQYFNAEQKSFAFTDYLGLTDGYIKAGHPYLITIDRDQFQIKAHDTEVLAEPVQDEFYISLYNEEDIWHNTHVGNWMGTFARISNEDAASMNAYTLNNNGKWYRIRSEEGRYRSAWVGAFRGYFMPQEPLSRNTLSTDYIVESQSDGEEEWVIYRPFDAKQYATDSDFSRYDDEGTGITIIPAQPREDVWFTMDGRKLDSKPKTKGLYIYKGKKIVIK